MKFIRFLTGGLVLIHLALFYLTYTNRFDHTARDFDYQPDRCTIHCEEHGCQHPAQLKSYYGPMVWQVNRLKVMATTYHNANFLVYFLAFPFLVYCLCYYVTAPRPNNAPKCS